MVNVTECVTVSAAGIEICHGSCADVLSTVPVDQLTFSYFL